jgi:hypothetical protein
VSSTPPTSQKMARMADKASSSPQKILGKSLVEMRVEVGKFSCV